VHQALGDSWYRAGEFHKSSEAYTAARGLVASDPLEDAGLLLKLSHVEAKLGQFEQALRWTEHARATLQGLEGPEAARQTARSGAWYAMVLQFEGRTTEALDWAERTVAEETWSGRQASCRASGWCASGQAAGTRPCPTTSEVARRP
jgi:tetratricopeptide (TPR) repeat protein